MVSLQLKCLWGLWLELRRFKHILKKTWIWPQWLNKFASLTSSREGHWKEQRWILPCYFSWKEQTPIPSPGPWAVLSRAAGAVLPSCQRMVAALQESVLWWSVLLSGFPALSGFPQCRSLTLPLQNSTQLSHEEAALLQSQSWCHL